MSEGVHEPVSQRLRRAANSLSGERVALRDISAAHGAAAQGTLLVMLAAPCMLPVSGVGSVLGCGLAMIGAALWRGEVTEHLPARVAGLEMPLPWARRVLRLMAAIYGLAARFLRPRLSRFSATDGRPWIAVNVCLMAVLIVLPIPFGNLLPALALILLGLGLVFSDGLAVLLSGVAGALALAFTAVLGVLAWYWGTAWISSPLGA